MKQKYLVPNTADNRYWFFCILALVFLSYGQFWTRGGYADDFAFLAYVTPRSYFSSMTGWPETFNSRLAQGVMMPLLMKGLAADTPEGFRWEIFHLIGIIAFCLTLYFVDGVLRYFSVSWVVRLIVLLIFAINPIKNEALLWPATIVGYVLPVCFFSLACWLYLRAIKTTKKNSSFVLRILAFGLIFFSLLAIEQLVPVFIGLLALRLVFLPDSRTGLVMDLIVSVGILVAFVGITVSGKTTDRMTPFVTLEPLSIVGRSFSVTLKSIKDMLGYGFNTVADPYYWPALATAAKTPGFIVAILGLMGLWWLMLSRPAIESLKMANKAVLGFLCTGTCIWLASLSPFMVISYYLPPRALFVPSFGLALIGTALLALFIRKANRHWLRTTCLAGLMAASAVFVLANIYAQHDFASSWQDEKKIIHYVSTVADQVPNGVDISIFNIPERHGPSPNFVNNFSMNGIVNWFSPGRYLSGSTRNDLSDVIEWEGNLTSVKEATLSVRDGFWFLLWTPDKVLRVNNLDFSPDKSDWDCSRLKSFEGPVDLRFVVKPLAQRSVFENEIALRIGGFIHSPCLNFGIVEVFVEIPDEVTVGPKLVLHAVQTDGARVPYDLVVNTINGFRQSSKGHRKYIFIRNFSSVSAIELSLGGLKNQNNTHTNDIFPGRDRKVDAHTAWPRINFF